MVLAGTQVVRPMGAARRYHTFVFRAWEFEHDFVWAAAVSKRSFDLNDCAASVRSQNVDKTSLGIRSKIKMTVAVTIGGKSVGLSPLSLH